eukprot:10014272-Alexandrium_andersonii.AAC.1
MARIRLVQEALGRPPDDAVQQLHLLQVLRASAEATLDFAHELLVHEVLDEVRVHAVAGEGEVAPVRDAPG